MNNSILSIGLDKENDLWLGLDNGIVHIEINSPISIFLIILVLWVQCTP
jgi:hypothetical protein